jgi:hypothetical protein
MVTGQIFFRDAGMSAPTKDGRKLMMVVGVIAVPSDFVLKPEHQYEISENKEGQLNCWVDSEIDLTEVARAQSASGLLKLPIWRC